MILSSFNFYEFTRKMNDNNLTCNSLAKELPTSTNVVSSILKCTYDPPHEMRERIEDILGVPKGYLTWERGIVKEYPSRGHFDSERFDKFIRDNNIDYEVLSQRADMSIQSIRNYRRGLNIPHPLMINRITDALGVDDRYFDEGDFTLELMMTQKERRSSENIKTCFRISEEIVNSNRLRSYFKISSYTYEDVEKLAGIYKGFISNILHRDGIVKRTHIENLSISNNIRLIENVLGLPEKFLDPSNKINSEEDLNRMIEWVNASMKPSEIEKYVFDRQKFILTYRVLDMTSTAFETLTGISHHMVTGYVLSGKYNFSQKNCNRIEECFGLPKDYFCLSKHRIYEKEKESMIIVLYKEFMDSRNKN